MIMYNGESLDVIMSSGNNYLLDGKKSYVVLADDDAIEYPKTTKGKSVAYASFLQRAIEPKIYNELGIDFFHNLNYKSQFKAVLYEEREEYKKLPEKYLDALYDAFLDGEFDITMFMSKEVLDTITEQADVNKYFEKGKKRVFVDMDGTLCKWQSVPYERLFEQGYFETLEPQKEFVSTIKSLILDEKYEVYILSAFLLDSSFALYEKNKWIDKHIPEIDPAHRIFTPCTETVNKADYIPSGIRETDILIDDYTKNLENWKLSGGIGLKVITDANNTKGTWIEQGGDYIDVKCGLEELKTHLAFVENRTGQTLKF